MSSAKEIGLIVGMTAGMAGLSACFLKRCREICGEEDRQLTWGGFLTLERDSIVQGIKSVRLAIKEWPGRVRDGIGRSMGAPKEGR